MVRPIERSENVLQAFKMERVQQVQQQHPDQQQRYFQLQLEQERRELLAKANSVDEPSKTEIKDDEEEKRRQREEPRQQAPRRNAAGGGENPEVLDPGPDPDLGNFINIKG
ncbi:MAG: hypothetical protein FWE89_00515 [Syntrophaceae bacterium]|nr:hypothetical protein [Syntrophaceae bacterium]